MVVSTNPEPSQEVFQSLLDDTIASLKSDASMSQGKYLELLGSKFEGVVADFMAENAKGTPFENSIKLIGGQRFPDIVAKKYYGVEVKTSKQNHWTTTGNSILENTRVNDVERIYMLFGKMISPVDFKCRPYEDCLSEVVVTHSPRYLIDMNLPQGQTIFDKLNIPYNTLRTSPNPVKPVIDYYKKFLKAGEEVWWLDTDESKSTGLIIKSWNNLSAKDREEFVALAMIYFPEVFSRSMNKFNAVGTWLINNHGIICPNMRDAFTAGGQGRLEWKGNTYLGVQKIIIRMVQLLGIINRSLGEQEKEVLEQYWGIHVSNKTSTWIDLVVENSKYMKLQFDLKEYLNETMNKI